MWANPLETVPHHLLFLRNQLCLHHLLFLLSPASFRKELCPHKPQCLHSRSKWDFSTFGGSLLFIAMCTCIFAASSFFAVHIKTRLCNMVWSINSHIHMLFKHIWDYATSYAFF